MREITEAQAQELANLSGCFVAVDSDGQCWTYKAKPHKELHNWNSHVSEPSLQLNICIISTRPWNEQIWRPQE